MALKSLCDSSEIFPESQITKTNLNSVIILINIDGKKFLFTGDAGVESFKAITDWKDKLKDIYWLKVPHHGSPNNLNQEIISIMNPKYSFISGNKRVSSNLVEFLRLNKSEVSITNEKEKHLEFRYSFINADM